MKKLTMTILIISIFFLFSCKNSGKSGNIADVIPLTMPFDFPNLQPPVFNNQTFDIRDYGAQSNDSAFLNTDAIKKAITACNQAGGGKVLVSSGIWHTGPIHLQSNVNLHLEEGAELRFSKNFEDYLPVVLIQRGGFFCYNYSPPMYARNCENIAITGTGILNGQGQAWWPWKQRQPGMVQLFEMGKKRVPVEQRVFGTVEAGVRPPFIQFLECKNVYLQGVTVIDGPSWNVHPVFCENVIIREIRVVAHGPNNDGINPDGCKNVLIEDCFLDAGDDALTMKSGRDEEAWEIGRPLENVVIRQCTVKKGNGGFVIGTEMSAGVRNILVEDCHFDGTSRGLRFKSRVGRGGIVENIWIRNITMKNIRNEAIIFNLLYDSEPIEKNMNYQSRHNELANAPTFRNFHIENVTCESAGTAIKLAGLPGNFLRELTFKNISIKAENGLISQDVHDLTMEEVYITGLAE
jgi:polygalacturonase